MLWKPRYVGFGEWLFNTINGKSHEEKDRIGSFGRKCKISRAQLYRYFTNKKRPSKQAMARMMKVLHLPVKLREQKERRNYKVAHIE